MCCKGLQTVNHRGVAQWRKKIYISADLCFSTLNPRTNKKTNTYIEDSRFCIQEEQLDRYDVLQLCDVFYIEPMKGERVNSICFCFSACVMMSAFKNHPNNTRLLYILMTIRVIGLWFITKRIYQKEVVSPAGQLWKKWIDTWPGSWGQWGRTSLKSHGQEPCGPSATTYVDRCNSQKTISAIHILNIWHILVLTYIQVWRNTLDVPHTCHRKTQVQKILSL